MKLVRIKFKIKSSTLKTTINLCTETYRLAANIGLIETADIYYRVKLKRNVASSIVTCNLLSRKILE